MVKLKKKIPLVIQASDAAVLNFWIDRAQSTNMFLWLPGGGRHYQIHCNP